MLLTTEKLEEALELISKGITRPTKIAQLMGISYRSYAAWMVKSNRGDEKFLVEYNGEVCQWAKAITLATKLALFELRGMLLQESIFGYDEIQTKDGQVVWALDPIAAAIDPEDRDWMGYRKDALLEIDGKLQPVVLKKKAPFAQQIRLLEAAFADLRPTQNINQNVNVNGQVGVAFAKSVDYSKGPPLVPPPPLRPELPAPVDAEFSEVDDDPELREMLGPDPGPQPSQSPVSIVVAPQINIAEPEPGISEPREPSPSLAFDALPPRSALEQSILDELERSRQRKARS